MPYDTVKDSIVDVIRMNVSGRAVGIAFSGGLDSGLVAALSKEYADSVTLYTCGTGNAYDVIAAKDLAEELDLPWVHVPLSKWTIEPRIREMISSTGTTDPFTISYELQLFCVCTAAKEDIILTGQGADEYFMGCAKFVDQTDSDYEVLKESSIRRLMDVSVPCEMRIAEHFGKQLVYPYLDSNVIEAVSCIDPSELRPTDMDSRKIVLKRIAIDLGYPVLAERKKKSSQYGSGTTDLIRCVAREKGMMYNEYIASLSDDVLFGKRTKDRGSVINARIDPMVKIDAEDILKKLGISPSDAIEMFYLKVIEDGDLRCVRRHR